MKFQKRYLRILIIALMLEVAAASMVQAAPTSADNRQQPPQTETWTEELLHQRTNEAEKALKAARKDATAKHAAQLGVDLNTLDSHVRKWVELISIYSAISEEIQKKAEFDREADAVQEEANAFDQRGLLKKPPFSLSEYDALLLDRESLQQQSEIAMMAYKAVLRNQETLRLQQRDAINQLDTLKNEKVIQPGPKKRLMLEDRQLDVRLIETKAQLQKRRSENLELQRQLAEKRADLAKDKATVVQLGLAYDESDLNKQLKALDIRKYELEKSLTLLRGKKQEVDHSWLKAQTMEQQAVFSNELVEMDNRKNGIARWRKTYQAAIDQHEEMLRLASIQQQTWQRRYELLKQVPERGTLLQWYEQSRLDLSHIDRVLPIEQQRQNSLWQQTNQLDDTTAQLQVSTGQVINGEQKAAIRQMAASRLDYIGMLVNTRGLQVRLNQEIDFHLEHQPLQYQLEKIWTRVSSLWNYQIWIISDRPLTVKMVLVALVILLVGTMATKMVIHRIAKRILDRPQIKPTTAATIEKLLLYSGYLMVALFALRMVNIPLAAFAFLGGAVAIGLGFGAQNLINNFISGFIIMGEQPINIGDLIEVDGVLGQVEEIGARCTRIRTGENIRILVPNSSFLEKNITNWTISDRLIRADVTVGVAYGSPVDEVEKRMLQACAENHAILKNPEPFVLLTDFGDNALIFKVQFWINVARVIERRMVESQMRFHIDALFRKANIEIAYPQRDIHMDSTEPLKIHVLNNGADANQKGKTDD